MKWQEGRQSDNVEDRRGEGGFRIGGLPVGAGGLGLGGVVVLLLLAWLTGTNPLSLLSGDQNADSVAPASAPAAGAPADEGGRFASSILADTEDTWTTVMRKAGRRYEPPHLVLFTDVIDSACGQASTATGPFYCPGDQKIYLDLSFYRELDQRFGAPGDFARAYVIAHEVGHHVQNELGLLERGGGMSRLQANAQSVRTELQADCLAGVWGHSAAGRGLLERGDVEEGLGAAAAVGDDRIQKQTRGTVVPESFTHGSSAERAAAFRKGLESGDLSACGIGAR